MSVSFKIPKSETVGSDNPPATFSAGEASPPPLNFTIGPISPIPNTWRPDLNSNSAFQFQPDNNASIDKSSDTFLGSGLNLRDPKLPKTSIADLELRKLRDDLNKLPDHMGINEFEDMPVQGYGEAILQGYGWRKGRGIGRSVVQDVKVMEVKTNIGRAGLGFIRGLEQNFDQLAEAKKLRNELAGLEVKEKNTKHDIKSVSWLRNHIRVRIISKLLKGGRLFSRTGVVLDVIGPETCDVMIDETDELVQGVKQDMLEVVLPKCGDLVVDLKSGDFGRLVELDLDKGTGVICHVDSHQLLSVMVHQIAEFTGDLTDICY